MMHGQKNIKLTGKGKDVPVYTTNAYRETRGTAPLIRTHGNWWNLNTTMNGL